MKNNHIPLFNEGFLEEQLQNFDLLSIDELESKKEILKKWYDYEVSGILDNLNETQLDVRFNIDIFETVLGFSNDPKVWKSLGQQKTNTDGTKSDAVLGFFSFEQNEKKVFVCCEYKDSKTDLDTEQKRQTDKRSPVEQAFSYAPKYGKTCKWVIVSNFKEIRLYDAKDQNKYEKFTLKGLQEDAQLKKFLFLMSQARLATLNQRSKTERLLEKQENNQYALSKQKSHHFLDKVYNLVKLFDGIPYVDPHLIANAPPFNNADNDVYHFIDFTLHSTEKGVYDFFKHISIEKDTKDIIISDDLKKELEKSGVTDYVNKIEFIIKRFNEFTIFKIACYEDVDAVKRYISSSNIIGANLSHGVHDYAEQDRYIDINAKQENTICNCVHCQYSKFDWIPLIKRINNRDGDKNYYTLENAYLHFIFCEYESCYYILKKIAENEKGKNLNLYFMAKYNITKLEWRVENEDLKKEIRAIDLDEIIYELDIASPTHKKALLGIKNETLINKQYLKAQKSVEKLKDTKRFYETTGIKQVAPNYLWSLLKQLIGLQSHYNRNFLIGFYGEFYQYFFEAAIISYLTDKRHESRLEQLNKYHLESIFEMRASYLTDTLKKYNIDSIEFSDEALENLVERSIKFFSLHYKEDSYWGISENREFTKILNNTWRFEYEHRSYFPVLLILLCKSNISHTSIEKVMPYIKKFISVESNLQYIVRNFSDFVKKYGIYFSTEDLVKILKETPSREHDLIKNICIAIKQNDPDFKLSQLDIFYRLVERWKQYDVKNFIYLWYITKENERKVIQGIFEDKLNKNFNQDLYMRILLEEIFHFNDGNYLELNIKELVRGIRGYSQYKFVNGNIEPEGWRFINFISMIHTFGISSEDERFRHFTDLCDWHSWLLYPEKFDYSNFKMEWIFTSSGKTFYNRYKNIPVLKAIIENSLKEKFDAKLSDVYCKYFL